MEILKNKNIKRVLVTGGAGYVGSVLVRDLLNLDYEVNILDLFIYGEDLINLSKKDNRLRIFKGDIRDLDLMEKSVTNCDAVIHLACISNDPSFDLNPDLGKSINLDCFDPFLDLCVKHKIKRFIYASSSSVYGVKDIPEVTENEELEPLTDYSKYKAECEKILFSKINNEFVKTILRPATVCGYSPRQRLDVVVNILTNLGYNKGEISILGGKQKRPNIHIQDMCDVYKLVLCAPEEKINNEIFNVGYENYTVENLASIVKTIVGDHVKLVYKETNDNRSYHVSSTKIKNILGFSPKYSINDAVESIVSNIKNGNLTNTLENSYYYNIKRMQEIDLK